MINGAAFATRLKKIMEHYNLSASAFSEEIDFNRSTISHLISGRNKPSLEFVMKVFERFPEVSVSWFLYGKGEFPTIDNKDPITTKQIDDNKGLPSNSGPKSPTTISHENKSNISSLLPTPSNNNKEIKKIVIFYSDFSFETYEN